LAPRTIVSRRLRWQATDVEHFSVHTGQIVFATKMLTGADLGFYRHLRTAPAHGEKTP